eukprot:TRINITY_DN18246_c0_g1_i1.p1 TRINITY_DN18246_c0_g1~~TRINITY_DN18246_c0_g1_i1.p1  ORF type:complete len:515 (-),score=198.53 TRINITY_DN18246_c0_g1_i1:131-1639(-)
MASKSGKPEPKSRNTLPLSASELSTDSSASSVAASASSTSSSSASMASSTKFVTTTSTYDNGAGFEDWAMPGFLNLKELNSLLLKYIGQVQDLELNQSQSGGSTSITVNIDRSEIISLQSKYDTQLADWKKQCDDKDKEIAALKAEIAKLKAEIKKLKESNANKDGTIKERDLTIEGLRAEISKLQATLSMFQNQKEIYEFQITRLQGQISYLTGELNAMTNAFASEQNRSMDLGNRLASMEKELRFKIDVLGSELASERGKTNIDISSLDTRIKNEYADRLKDELKVLRKIYEEHMRVSQETLEMSYKKKISDLEVSLAVQMNSVKPTEDITGLRVDLEKYKKKVEELDSNNRNLSMQWSKLSVELRDKEATFNAKMSAKEIEMAYMAKQNAEYKKMYEEMRSKMLYEESEVKVYNRLITPEVDRIRRASEQFSRQSMSSSKTTLNFSRNSDGEMNGSSSDEESSKTVKVSQTMTKTSTAQKVTKEAVQNSSSTASSVKKN